MMVYGIGFPHYNIQKNTANSSRKISQLQLQAFEHCCRDVSNSLILVDLKLHLEFLPQLTSTLSTSDYPGFGSNLPTTRSMLVMMLHYFDPFATLKKKTSFADGAL